MINEPIDENDKVGPIEVAEQLCYFAHGEQRRRNGEPYRNHPLRMKERFLDLISYKKNIDPDKLEELGIPLYGVIEVALLHDVIEDTDVTLDGVKDFFEYTGQLDYFENYIKEALSLITHDKSEPYQLYIEKIMANPISSMVKMLDLEDNLQLFGLNEIDHGDVERSKRYVHYFRTINKKHRYLEKIYAYKKYIEECMDKGDPRFNKN